MNSVSQFFQLDVSETKKAMLFLHQNQWNSVFPSSKSELIMYQSEIYTIPTIRTNSRKSFSIKKRSRFHIVLNTKVNEIMENNQK